MGLCQAVPGRLWMAQLPRSTAGSAMFRPGVYSKTCMPGEANNYGDNYGDMMVISRNYGLL